MFAAKVEQTDGLGSTAAATPVSAANVEQTDGLGSAPASPLPDQTAAQPVPDQTSPPPSPKPLRRFRFKGSPVGPFSPVSARSKSAPSPLPDQTAAQPVQADEVPASAPGSAARAAEKPLPTAAVAVGSVVFCSARQRPNLDGKHAVVHSITKTGWKVQVVEGPACMETISKRKFGITAKQCAVITEYPAAIEAQVAAVRQKIHIAMQTRELSKTPVPSVQPSASKNASVSTKDEEGVAPTPQGSSGFSRLDAFFRQEEMDDGGCSSDESESEAAD